MTWYIIAAVLSLDSSVYSLKLRLENKRKWLFPLKIPHRPCAAGLVGWTRAHRVTHAFTGLPAPPPQNGAPFISFHPAGLSFTNKILYKISPFDGKFGAIFGKLLPSYILTSGSLNQPKMLSKNWIKSIITNVCPLIRWASQMSSPRASAVCLWAHTRSMCHTEGCRATAWGWLDMKQARKRTRKKALFWEFFLLRSSFSFYLMDQLSSFWSLITFSNTQQWNRNICFKGTRVIVNTEKKPKLATKSWHASVWLRL